MEAEWDWELSERVFERFLCGKDFLGGFLSFRGFWGSYARIFSGFFVGKCISFRTMVLIM